MTVCDHCYLYLISMTEHCCNDKALKESGKVFVDSVSRLIGLILDYRNVQDDNDYRGQRMGCILNLLVCKG